MPRRHLVVAAAAAFVAAAWAALDPAHDALSLLLVALALVVAGAAWLESGPGSAKEIALVATLGGAAAAGRVLFAAIPDVQPVTVIVAAAGVALGARAGFAVGGVAALASNFLLGQGVWTPWQMLAWGGCGLAAAACAPLVRRRLPFALFCVLLGYAYGLVLDFWNWYAFYPHTWPSFVARQAAGFSFNTAHAAGNAVIALAVGPELRRLLARYGRRLRTEVVWA